MGWEAQGNELLMAYNSPGPPLSELVELSFLPPSVLVHYSQLAYRRYSFFQLTKGETVFYRQPALR